MQGRDDEKRAEARKEGRDKVKGCKQGGEGNDVLMISKGKVWAYPWFGRGSRFQRCGLELKSLF